MNTQQKRSKPSQVNKLAGFWIRFLARGIDTIMLVSLTIGMASLNIHRVNGIVEFKEPWNFYLWIIVTMIVWPVYFIIVPLGTNGYTVGSYIGKIKIKLGKNSLSELIKREMFFSLLFMINLGIVLVIVNHTLINRFFQMNQKGIKYTTMENFRISVPTTVFSLGMLMQMAIGITIIVKKGRGYNDKFSNTDVIYVNKFIKVKKEIKIKISSKYKPKLIEQEKIEWIK